MNLRTSYWMLLSLLLITGTFAMVGLTQTPDESTLRQQAETAFGKQNWKDAFEAYRQLAVNPMTSADKVARDLELAVDCQRRLNLFEDLDKLLSESTEHHANNWQLLMQAAKLIDSSPHYGIVADQKFHRAPSNRQTGSWINASEQDRQQALIWLNQALALALKSVDEGKIGAKDLGSLHLLYAQLLLQHRGDRLAWRLQQKTNLENKPDYLDFEAPSENTIRFAPVTAEGNPVFYSAPKNLSEATNDGERFRWLIDQTIEISPENAPIAKLMWGDFLNSQFSVDTLQQDFWIFRTTDDTNTDKDKAETAEGKTGIFQIHTLSDEETIARLASGIKRFPLPDAFNPIKIYQDVAKTSAPQANESKQRLANIYMNRRQYSRAADILKQMVASSNDNSAKQQLANIVEPRAQFDPQPSQLAGQGATASLLFRNATSANFTAHQVDVEKLLADIKKFFQDARGQQRPAFGGIDGAYPPNIENPQELFQKLDLQRYITSKVAEWNLKLEPRDNHWDRRIDVATPLQKAGLYVVTVHLDDNKHTARTLMWIQDTALVRKPLSEKQLYLVADAKTGNPIAGANVEFFGFGMMHDPNGGRGTWKVKNFAKRSDAQGQVILSGTEYEDNLQWLTIARTNDKRLAFFGIDGLWRSIYQPQQYSAQKAYGVSDRPIYRPGDTLHAKFWLATASYSPDIPTTPAIGEEFTVQVMDPQNKVFWTGAVKTDQFGGAEIEIPLSKQCSLGSYQFLVIGKNGPIGTELIVRVEEYRKPEFEVKIESPSDPIKLGEKFKAKVEAKYYFGTPVAGATATIRVERTAYNDEYYPVAPYDWCYGPGYWWSGYDYPWYPGWARWVGCRPPHPFWFPHFGNEPPELVLEQQLTLDQEGRGEVEIDSALAKAIHGQQDHRYNISVEVRDASRRVITASGQVIASREAFKIYSWLHRGYYRVGDKIQANFSARTLGGKPVTGSGKLSLLRIEYDAERKPTESVVEQWDVKTDNEGQLVYDLEAKRSGQYRLKLELTDNAEHTVEGAFIFTIRGESDLGSNFRFTGLELIPDLQQYQPGNKVKLQINADRDDAIVALFIRPENGVYPAPQYVKLQGKTKIVEIPVLASDQPNFFVEAMTIYGGEVHSAVREIIVPPQDRVLNVKLTSNKAEYLPGEEAEVQVQITDPTGEPVVGSTVLAVYDRALEALAGNVLPRDIREFFWKWRRHHHPFTLENLSRIAYPIYLEKITAMSPIGIFGHNLADDADNFDRAKGGGIATRKPGGMRGFGGGAVMRSAGGRAEMAAPMMADAAPAGAAMMKGAVADAPMAGAMGGGGAPENQAPKIRQDFADSAFWLGNVVADDSGKATLRFKMPESLTSWSIRSWAVGSNVRVGSATTTAVTRKNLMVRLQTPRFLVERDEVTISALVNNELKEAKDVKVRLEIDGETQLQLLSTAEQTVRVEAGSQTRVDWKCKAIAEGEVTLRTLAISDTESDAMQLKLPVIVNGILKTESFAGTIRGEKASSGVKLSVPAERRPEQSRLTVRLSPSLAAAMIDALPYMVEYPYGCTEQTLNRFLPTVITQRTLQKMQLNLADIAKKRNNLNAQELGLPEERRTQWKRFDINPVFSETEVASMVEQGVNKLTEMQNADGGWGWFSGVGEQSWPHTTAVVVRGLLIARENDVAIVPDVLERGLQWLEQHQLSELQKLKNAESKTEPYKISPDNNDALVFHTLVMADRLNPEMQTLLVEKREALSVYSKSLLAIATHKTGNMEQTDLLRQNIEQFLVQDAENETAFLRDNSPWWYWYGSEIEAMATYLKLLTRVDPQNPIAPRMVKYLLNQRKHSTYWNSTRDTSMVIEAFAEYLSTTGELKPNITAEVWLDDKRLGTVQFTQENLFDVNNTIEIVGDAITTGDHQLEIRRTDGSGSIYWNAYLTQFTREEEIAAAGLEVKVERRFYRQDRVKKDLSLAGDRGEVVDAERSALTRISLEDLQDLPSGTLVEIELLIESKNDYEYLMLEDRKPAGLEAVDTQSGYFYAGGLSAYRELRDQKTAFFLRTLPRGQHSIRYQLRAEAPGTFTALPAQISGMYAPELSGNSKDFDLKVVE